MKVVVRFSDHNVFERFSVNGENTAKKGSIEAKVFARFQVGKCIILKAKILKTHWGGRGGCSQVLFLVNS